MKKKFAGLLAGVSMAALLLSGCASHSINPAPKSGTAETVALGETSGVDTSNAEYTLIAAHVSSTEHSFQKGLEVFKKEVEEKSGGRVAVEIHPNGELGGNEKELVQKMATGTVDVIIAAPSFMAQSVKESDLFSLPYLFSSVDHWQECMEGDPGKEMKELVEDKSGMFRVLGYFKDGVRSMYTVKPVEKLEDMKDMKFRIQNSPIQTAFWTKLGVQPTTVAFNEIYQALQNKVIDGAENSYSQIYQQKHYEVCKNITMTEHDVATRFLLISQYKYNALPDDLRTIVDEAGEDAARAQVKIDGEMDVDYKQKMMDAGVTFHEIDKQQLIDLTSQIRDDKAAELGNKAEAIYNEINAMKK